MNRDRRGLLLAVLGGSVVALLLQRSRSVGTTLPETPVIDAILGDLSAPRSTPKGADVTLVVFTDYQCPACRLANCAMHSVLADDPLIGVVYKDWPIFGPISERAARIAIASASQGRYAALHDGLMRYPRRLDDANLRMAALAAGVDWERLVGDLTLRRLDIDRILAKNAFDAFSLGLKGTPGYLANRILVEGAITERQSRDVFARARAAR